MSSPPAAVVTAPDGLLFDDDVLIPAPAKHKKSKGPPSDRGRAFAARLREAVNRTDFRHPYNPTDWAREFDVLLRDRADADVAEVLEWFYASVRLPYTPRVRCAKSFRVRFGDLEEAMSRDHTRRPPAPTTLSREAEFVVTRLRMMNWPKGADAQLAGAVERSVKNLRAWYGRLSRARLPRNMEPVRDRVVALIGGYETYLEDWWSRVWRKYHSWRDWSADLGQHVWTPDHPWFVDAATAAVAEYTRVPAESFDALAAEVGGA